MKTTIQYETRAVKLDCFDEWLEDNLERLKTDGILDKILCISQENSGMINIFEKTIDTTHTHDIYEDTPRIEIGCKGYYQSEYDTYNIYAKNVEDREEIEEAFEFIEDIFTIQETRVELYTREVIEKDGKEYREDWEEFDVISSIEEFADVDKLTNELLVHNKLKLEDLKHRAEEAIYIG